MFKAKCEDKEVSLWKNSANYGSGSENKRIGTTVG